jgi:hypothetical protein
MSLRFLILIVALAGLLMGAEVLRRRSVGFQRLASRHRMLEFTFSPLRHDSYDEEGELESSAKSFHEEALAHRHKQAEAQRALDAKRAAGEPTTQTDRRDPWYWGMRADEAEWSAREAHRKLTSMQDSLAYHGRMRRRFEHAVFHPWESVSISAPPPPDFTPTDRPQPVPPPP